MVTIPLKCPHCESTDVGRHGVSAVGKKRYACRNTGCGKTFQEDYSFKGYQPGTRSEIYFMAVNGNGVRATARVLGISKDTVIATLVMAKTCWFRKIHVPMPLYRHPEPYSAVVATSSGHHPFFGQLWIVGTRPG